MEFKAVVKRAKNNELTIRTKDEINIKELSEKAIRGHTYGVFEVYEKDTITDLQRKHYWALVGDYSEFTGVPEDATDSYFKFKFMQEEGLDELPSVSRNAMTKSMATKFLTFIITSMIQSEVPFRKQKFYLTTHTQKYLYALTMKRLCWVCGKPHSDMAHAEAVGAGRDRNKIDHTQHRFMSLCRYHHQEQHSIGLKEFCKKYHFKPIKLKADDLKELDIKGDYGHGN